VQKRVCTATGKSKRVVIAPNYMLKIHRREYQKWDDKKKLKVNSLSCKLKIDVETVRSI